MRKKDKPVGLMVALGVLITGALVYNGAQSGLFRNLGNSGGGEAKVGEARSTDKDYDKSVAAKASAVVDEMTDKASAGRAKGVAEFRASLKGRPLMALPKASDYKPKPNESSTSTQWYR
jgi:hypothetical protein